MPARFLPTHFAAFYLILLILANVSRSQEPSQLSAVAPVEPTRLLREQIAPVLAARCHACHGVKQEGGYSVASPAKLFVAGDSEAKPVVGKEPSKSELWRRLISKEASERMPVDAAPLTENQLTAIKVWIEAGAPVASSDLERNMMSIAITRAVSAPEHYPRAVAINAMALSPNSESVWVGGYAEATHWRVATGELMGRVPVSGPHIAAIAVEPDGSSLVVSSGLPGQRGLIERIHVNDPNFSRVTLDATADVSADLAITKDGLHVAIGGHDGSLRVVELLSDHSFGRTATMTPHADAVLALAWSADSGRLVTASRDRTAKLFDCGKMELIASFDRHERAVGGAAFLLNRPLSLDETGRLRLMAGDDSDGVVAEQSGLPRLLQRFVTEGDEIFIPDRHRLRELRIETKTTEDGKDEEGKPKKKTVTKFREGSVLEVDSRDWITSVAANAAALAVGTQQGSITVWDRRNHQRLGTFLAKP